MTKRAIVIGIGPSKISTPLMDAADDAQRVRTLLLGRDARAQVATDDAWSVEEVIADNAHDPYQGSELHIRTAFESWVGRMARERDPDRLHLLIYFAGHAALTEDDEVELLGTDDGWTTLGELASAIQGISAQNVTIILDCCHAGALSAEFRRLLDESGSGLGGRAVFAACTEEQQAVGHHDKGGVFTNLILQGLGLDPDVPPGAVTASRLEAYVNRNWMTLPERVRARQRPVASATTPLGEDVPLVELVRPDAVTAQTGSPAGGEAAGEAPLIAVDGPIGDIRAQRTADGAQLFGVSADGGLHPWLVHVPLAPAERLLAVTSSFDDSTAWLAVADESRTQVLRVRVRDGVKRFVVEGAGAARRARFGGHGERDVLLLETADGAERRVPVGTLLQNREAGTPA